MVKGMIFDVGGVLAYDVWENLLPARDKKGGIAKKFQLDKDQVHRVGALEVKYAIRDVPQCRKGNGSFAF